MQQMIFIADLIACSTCFGHHHAHHQELQSIIQVAAACRICCCKNYYPSIYVWVSPIVSFPQVSPSSE